MIPTITKARKCVTFFSFAVKVALSDPLFFLMLLTKRSLNQAFVVYLTVLSLSLTHPDIGEVFDYLVAHGRMKEKEARAKFRQVRLSVCVGKEKSGALSVYKL